MRLALIVNIQYLPSAGVQASINVRFLVYQEDKKQVAWEKRKLEIHWLTAAVKYFLLGDIEKEELEAFVADNMTKAYRAQALRECDELRKVVGKASESELLEAISGG